MEFIRYNNNPRSRKAADCVVRALSLALDKSWYQIYRELSELGLEECRMINEPDLYQLYLKKQDLEKQRMPKRPDNTRYTVKEFANELADPDKIYILSIAHHITVIKNKDLYDTWDCSHKSVGNYWVV